MKDGLENIEEVFKQTFDGFEANVDPSVWANVQSAIGSGAAPMPQIAPAGAISAAGKSMALKIVAGVIAVGAVATATYFVFDKPVENNKAIVAENIVVENSITENDIEEAVDEVDFSTEKESDLETSKENVVSNVEEEVILRETEVAAEIEENVLGEENNVAESLSAVTGDETEVNNSNEEKSEEETVVVGNNTNKDEQQTEQRSQPAESIAQENKTAVIGIVPNVITPNGDGDNDILKITGENLERIEVFIMDINQKVVFTFKTLNDEWQGKDQSGNDLPAGKYLMAGSVMDVNGNVKKIKKVVTLFK